MRVSAPVPKKKRKKFSISRIFAAIGDLVIRAGEKTGDVVPGKKPGKGPKVKDEVSAHIRISKTILDKVIEKKSAVLSSNVLADVDYKFAESIILDKIKSFMCAPLYLSLIHI